jgi:hypothetical protein
LCADTAFGNLHYSMIPKSPPSNLDGRLALSNDRRECMTTAKGNEARPVTNDHA